MFARAASVAKLALYGMLSYGQEATFQAMTPDGDPCLPLNSSGVAGAAAGAGSCGPWSAKTLGRVLPDCRWQWLSCLDFRIVAV